MKLSRRRRKPAPETAEPASAPRLPGAAAADFLQHRPACAGVRRPPVRRDIRIPAPSAGGCPRPVGGFKCSVRCGHGA
jgi:hypothetical protein